MFTSIVLRLLESIFRRPLLNAIPLVLGLAAGIAFVSAREPVYIATAGISVQLENFTETTLGLASGEFVWTTPADATVADIQELFASDSIIRSIISVTDLEADFISSDIGEADFFAGVRSDIWVQSVGEQLFAVSARAESPELAEQLVGATITTFLNWHSSVNLADAASSIDFFSEQLALESAEYDAAQNNLRNFLIEFPSPIRDTRSELEQLQADYLLQSVNQAATRISETRSQLDIALLSYKLAETDTQQQFIIVDPPEAPPESIYTPLREVLTVLIFTAIGLVISVLLIMLQTLLDRKPRYPVDIRIAHGLPVLASIPMRPGHSEMLQKQPGRFMPQTLVTMPANNDRPTIVMREDEKFSLHDIAQQRTRLV